MNSPFERFIGKRITIFVDVGGEKSYKYGGMLKGVEEGFLSFLDDREGLILFNASRIISVKEGTQ